MGQREKTRTFCPQNGYSVFTHTQHTHRVARFFLVFLMCFLPSDDNWFFFKVDFKKLHESHPAVSFDIHKKSQENKQDLIFFDNIYVSSIGCEAFSVV